jgi:D-alanyl-D-alanine carboxypeptidase (penicillin-binding protein 5/6)
VFLEVVKVENYKVSGLQNQAFFLKWIFSPFSLALYLFVSLLIILLSSQPSLLLARERLAVADLEARAAVLLDLKSGVVIFSKNAHVALAPASTTKIMTAIVVLEKSRLSEVAAVSQRAVAVTGAKLGLRPGELISIENLLYALLLYSANDAAVALAEHVTGSELEFVKLMNKKLAQLGAKNSHFSNAHGLDEFGHLATAYDLALVARYAMRNSKFAQIVKTPKKIIQWQQGKRQFLARSRNKLLELYPGAMGVKTGHTRRAGYCLVAAAKKGETKLLAVLLGERSESQAYKEATKLLDYGFSRYQPEYLVKQKKVYKILKLPFGRRLKLVAAKDLIATVRQRPRNISREIKILSKPNLPIKKHQKLGYLKVYQDDLLLGSVDLLAANAVPKPGFFERLNYFWHRFSSWVRARLTQLFR